ncbi:MAG: MBL fold metallo-hydrolase [Solobacterium sp.]|jgi:7,8-dihydropterin-6-yl-methyl-4-(beta-D-ribofuranosyl)aminobenzene 5'-phosphate synthase|nr:MBL fold metallo-hydrolase [Solobacterium sp.]
MKLTALVENTSAHGLKTVHGLSLYIETSSHHLLFDVGPDDTLFQNARELNIDLKSVDTVILSHGHNDHGGALKQFLEHNHTAQVYVQRKAFEPHYSMSGERRHYNGLDQSLIDHPQIHLLDGDTRIDKQLYVFTVSDISTCHSTANDTLYDDHGLDCFGHEQNLIIQDDVTMLVMGCGHTGIVNILKKAEPFHPTYCIGGYHLYHPRTKQTVSTELLSKIAGYMNQYPEIQFDTCHCTGMEAFEYLSSHVSNMHYLSCGDCIDTASK